MTPALLFSTLLTLLLAGSDARAEGTFWMPEAASTTAREVDFLYYYIYWLDVFFFVLIVGAIGYFAIRYRAKSEDQRTSPVKGNHALELAWSAIPSVFLISFFYLGFTTYIDMQVPPADAMDVRVTGQKWTWSFKYPEQGIATDYQEGLVVPSNTPIRLTMNSVDVLHSFYVPDFRVKQDVVPNRYSVLWFEAKKPGEYQVFCTEYCGDDHSRMLTMVKALEPAKYREWVAEKRKDIAAADADPVKKGQMLFTGQGCAGCHSIDGSKMVGPTLQAKYGAQEQLADGSSVTIDDNYIRESIVAPGAKVVAGYAPQMPPYQGRLSDDEIDALIDYIKTLQ